MTAPPRKTLRDEIPLPGTPGAVRVATAGLGCLIGKGYSDKELCALLHLTPSALKSRIKRAFQDAQARNRAQLAAICASALDRLAPEQPPDQPKRCVIAPFCMYRGYCS